MTADERTVIRTEFLRILRADLADEVKADALDGLFKRLVPYGGATEAAVPKAAKPSKPVGIEYIQKLIGRRCKKSRAYEIARNLPGRIDCGDSRLRFSKAALDAHFANGGDAILPKKRGRCS